MSERGKRVSWVELYLDLVFVLAIGQLAHLIVDRPSTHSVWVALGLFVTLWWTWVGFAVLYNRRGADTPAERLLFLAGSVPAGVAAVAIEPASAGDVAVFALSLAVVRLGQRGPRPPVNVQIDFEGLSQRIIAIPNVPERQYLDLQAGVDGQVFYMEAPRPAGVGGGGGGGGGNELMRYRLCERRATTFANNVAAYEISADRRKLVYRAGGGGGGQVWWSRWRRWYSASLHSCS